MEFEEIDEQEAEQNDELENITWNQMKFAIIIGTIITLVLISPIIWIAWKIGH